MKKFITLSLAFALAGGISSLIDTNPTTQDTDTSTPSFISVPAPDAGTAKHTILSNGMSLNILSDTLSIDPRPVQFSANVDTNNISNSSLNTNTVNNTNTATNTNNNTNTTGNVDTMTPKTNIDTYRNPTPTRTITKSPIANTTQNTFVTARENTPSSTSNTNNTPTQRLSTPSVRSTTRNVDTNTASQPRIALWSINGKNIDEDASSIQLSDELNAQRTRLDENISCLQGKFDKDNSMLVVEGENAELVLQYTQAIRTLSQKLIHNQLDYNRSLGYFGNLDNLDDTTSGNYILTKSIIGTRILYMDCLNMAIEGLCQLLDNHSSVRDFEDLNNTTTTPITNNTTTNNSNSYTGQTTANNTTTRNTSNTTTNNTIVNNTTTPTTRNNLTNNSTSTNNAVANNTTSSTTRNNSDTTTNNAVANNTTSSTSRNNSNTTTNNAVINNKTSTTTNTIRNNTNTSIQNNVNTNNMNSTTNQSNLPNTTTRTISSTNTQLTPTPNSTNTQGNNSTTSTTRTTNTTATTLELPKRTDNSAYSHNKMTKSNDDQTKTLPGQNANTPKTLEYIHDNDAVIVVDRE
ncbi:MAG: hypothetical protein IKC79_03470 [Clostridia bacterium]|nr:hypothetical protein [Clostridia bacterium]